eukprot:scaffold386_cov281-Prasinococcus_capsulatus_cf.AAC.3
MLSYDNVPLKKEKAFVNFALNSFALRHHPQVAHQMWQAFQECIKPPEEAAAAAAANGDAAAAGGQTAAMERPHDDAEPAGEKTTSKQQRQKTAKTKAEKDVKPRDGSDAVSKTKNKKPKKSALQGTAPISPVDGDAENDLGKLGKCTGSMAFAVTPLYAYTLVSPCERPAGQTASCNLFERELLLAVACRGARNGEWCAAVDEAAALSRPSEMSVAERLTALDDLEKRLAKQLARMRKQLSKELRGVSAEPLPAPTAPASARLRCAFAVTCAGQPWSQC